MNDESELLDIGAAARLLNVSETSLRRWTNAGVLPCMRIGPRRERRFRRGDLMAFLEEPAPAQRSAEGNGGVAMVQPPQNELITVTHGNHLCGIYGSEEGRLSLFVPFLLEGLKERSVCLLVATPAIQKKILKGLQGLHSELASDIRNGRLILATYESSCKAELKALAKQLSAAQKTGATSFRGVADLIGLRAQCPPEKLTEYEAGLDAKIISKFPIAILCAYDAREFTGLEVLHALKVHPDTLSYPLGRALG